jgi:hypothetical protein
VPISDKQLAANRANAAKSTGRRTRVWKARSHGFTAVVFRAMSPAFAGDGEIEIARAQNRLGRRFPSHGPASQRLVAFPALSAKAERLYCRAVEEFDRLKSAAARITKRTHSGGPTRRKRTACAPSDEPISAPVGPAILPGNPPLDNPAPPAKPQPVRPSYRGSVVPK